ncbi:MAG: sigma-54 dependent transcriptional regulator, acetoin dehydrogenase operon transcriptional [Tepidanaerobacteraceae bacterium]|nr:sigma-54 dependent transcriptional regulator, acetoin dehydrogenase operon transcriptional [Tepidanaerobacteraceae bacterium]
MKWSNEQETYIRRVYKDWENFITSGKTEGLTVRAEILESWQRCYRIGIPPDLWASPTVFDDDRLQQEKDLNRNLIEAASPLVKEISGLLYGTGQVIVLCDAKTIVLEIAGDTIALRDAANVNLLPGSGIGEPYHGTTGVALAMAKRGPATILATEHYCTGPKDWACVATPIMNINSKDVVGVLALTGRYMDMNKHSLGLIISAAKAIENRLLEQHMRHRNILLNAFMESVLRKAADVIIAIDVNGDVVSASNQSHPVLFAMSQSLKLLPPLEQIIKQILITPSLASNRIDSIEISIGKKYTVTYNPVFKNQTLCGILLNVYGNSTSSNIVNGSNICPPSAKRELNHPNLCIELVGNSPAFTSVIDMAKRAASSDSSVLIQGETGVGKEGIARTIHLSSHRARGPFIAVNCGGLPRDLIAGELFGYAPGAFTGASSHGKMGKFEAASGGTLFLDEIGELSLEAQAYLLRVLEEKEIVRLGSNKPVSIDVRVISATNRDLLQLIREGRFREDLYFRLNVIEINVPPLRERIEDLPDLIAHFMSKYGMNGRAIRKETIQALSLYPWPGNIRELRNVVQRAVTMGWDVEETLLKYVEPYIRDAAPACGQKKPLEIDPIIQALQDYDGNVTQAARKLGVARSTIYRHLKKNKVKFNRNIEHEYN